MSTNRREESLTLEILEAIEAQSDVTQRHLAQRLGVALGLANSYLKRCVRKGLVKIHQAPANRYLYYLTPQGFAEKSRLTARYLSYSFSFYRKAGESLLETFATLKQDGRRRVLLCGASELAEIASLRAREAGVRVVGVYDPHAEDERFLNRRIERSLDGCEPWDACVITDLADPGACYARMARVAGAERVAVPSILGLRRHE